MGTRRTAMLSIGVLGAGSHSRAFHGPALKILRDRGPADIELAGVCDIDRAKAESYARQFGFARVYDGLEAMLAGERLDAIVAVTPMERTEELAGRILRAGIPVLVEKPPGLDLPQARRLAEVARQTGTPHMVSMNRRFCPALVRAQQWMQLQPARRPRLVLARMVRHKRREDNFVAHTGIHLVDAVIWLLGRPGGIQARRLATDKPHSHLYHATMRSAGGAEAVLVFASAVGAVEETYEILGEDYRVLVDALASALSVHDAGKEVLNWRVAPGEPPAVANGTLDETAAFLEALRTGRWAGPNLTEAVESFQAAWAIQSAGQGDGSD